MKRIYWLILIIILAIGAVISSYFYYRTVTKTSANPPSPTASSPTADSGTVSQIKIFLVAPGDNGKSGLLIGCGDSVVSVLKEISPTKAPLKASIEELLKIKDFNYGESGFVNSLYQSNLTFVNANIVDAKATIKLSGNLVVAGVCDIPRVKAQLEQTALQFSTVKSVEFYINSQKLDDVLSQK